VNRLPAFPTSIIATASEKVKKKIAILAAEGMPKMPEYF
jgi:hypothetical protein